MKPNNTLRKIVLILIILLTVLSIIIFVSTKYALGSWFTILIGVIGAAFLSEVFKTINGRESFWIRLSFRDKLITVIDFFTILLLGLIPIKLGMPSRIVFISILLGLIIAWLITRRLGSEFLRKKMFTSSKDD